MDKTTCDKHVPVPYVTIRKKYESVYLGTQEGVCAKAEVLLFFQRVGVGRNVGSSQSVVILFQFHSSVFNIYNIFRAGNGL
jgi:hypothetical protein